MGRAWPGTSPLNSRLGPLSTMWAAGLSRSRNFISGPHRHESAWAKRSFPLFFSLKLSEIKNQHKTWARPTWSTSPARRPGPDNGQILKISSSTRHDLSFTQARVSSPWTGSSRRMPTCRKKYVILIYKNSRFDLSLKLHRLRSFVIRENKLKLIELNWTKRKWIA